MIKYPLIIILSISLLFCFSACSQCNQTTVYSNNAYHNYLVSESTFELSTEMYGLESGKLLLTISNARKIYNSQDIPANGGFVQPLHLWQVKNNEYIDYHDDKVFGANGSFLKNAYMVLVDVTVESQAAVAVTDPNEGMVNDDPYLYEDPYIFDCAMIRLTDLGGNVYQGLFPTMPVTYYSRKDMCQEHPRYYRLEPGETISFTLGFLVGGYREDGSLIDPSDLALGATMGETNAAYVLLGLEG